MGKEAQSHELTYDLIKQAVHGDQQAIEAYLRYVAMEDFDEDVIKKEFEDTLDICKRNGCAVEFILKDISTVHHQPERLNKWAEIAMKAVCG